MTGETVNAPSAPRQCEATIFPPKRPSRRCQLRALRSGPYCANHDRKKVELKADADRAKILRRRAKREADEAIGQARYCLALDALALNEKTVARIVKAFPSLGYRINKLREAVEYARAL
jgi:hypothetical protein